MESKVNLVAVDDDPESLGLIERALFPKYRLEKFSSALMALESLKEGRPVAVVLAAQRMPDMSGTEFLARARELWPDASRILLASGSEPGAIVEAVNRARVTSVVEKPLVAERLAYEVEQGVALHLAATAGREQVRELTRKNEQLSTAQKAMEKELRTRQRELEEAKRRVEEHVEHHAMHPGSAAVGDEGEVRRKMARLERALERERGLREHTEQMLEDKSRDLYTALETLRQQQAKLLGEKLQALGRISAGVAHEINNALNFVRGNIQHLPRYVQVYEEVIDCAHGFLKKDPAALAELEAFEKGKRLPYFRKDLPKLLGAIGTGVERATTIVRDLGVFSKSHETAEYQTVELKEPLDVALTLSSSRIKKSIKIDVGPYEVPQVRCQPGRICQVFLNLVFNASDAMEEGGQIRVTFRQQGKFVIAAVADSGAGIPLEVRARLFEPFFTTKEPGKGTGLGLFMCRKLVQEHGGEFWFESEIGKGTTFFMSLPISGPPEPGTVSQGKGA